MFVYHLFQIYEFSYNLCCSSFQVYSLVVEMHGVSVATYLRSQRHVRSCRQYTHSHNKSKYR